MGVTYATIRLTNGDDASDYRRGKIGEDEIRYLEITPMVDTGAIMLVINEVIKDALGLEIIGNRPSQLADGRRINLPVAGPVIVEFLDRSCITSALVLPDDQEPLLGVIPLEEMDLHVVPSRNELLPVHPEGPVMLLKNLK